MPVSKQYWAFTFEMSKYTEKIAEQTNINSQNMFPSLQFCVTQLCIVTGAHCPNLPSQTDVH
jgi:hypothetical protein